MRWSPPLPTGFEWLQSLYRALCHVLVASALVAHPVREADVLAVGVRATFGHWHDLVGFWRHWVELAAFAAWILAGLVVLSCCEANGLVYWLQAEPAVSLLSDDKRPDLVSRVSVYSAWVVLGLGL